MLRLVLAALVGAAALTGCAHTCNLMWAPSAFTVDLDAEGFEPGVWRIEVDGIGCTLPLPAADTDVAACDDWAYLDHDDAVIYALTVEEHTPKHVGIRVLRDDTVLVDVERTPRWRESEPNGEGCGTRRLGEEAVVVP